MVCNSTYSPPYFLRNGAAMTAYTALWAGNNWESTISHPEPLYQQVVFTGGQDVPIFGWVAIPENAHSTIIGTYGITGELEQQWFLRLLGRKAYSQGYAVVLFDWRAHGKTAELSPTLTSDGLYEGEDFVKIAQQAVAMGCPPKCWFTGYSLGGQLALWGIKAATDFNLKDVEIVGGAVICPSLDSLRSLTYIVTHPFGKYVESRIAGELKKLAWKLHHTHDNSFDSAAIERANSIWGFDEELVIGRLGFSSVEEYYEASSGLHLLPLLQKPTLIIYAADDPLFHPDLVDDLKVASAKNPAIDLLLTSYGGHVGYISSKKCQIQSQDPDQWWAWNRILEWIGINKGRRQEAEDRKLLL
ncbi:YheT family hydrolase [Sphaerospermopsis sp. LEGE 08334]|uniref:YheT family hydrolase n=1 Tax=Sphaerospermopsis sp. LEGE 08334 TaxID=1828651 RepID=UPI001880ADA7|nr:alpha/beta fold hydrolase [Sphaerospermopsis sp. LEGE 08334]MBE9057847.1 alpha/beta fold hydrolase [Sphaerospermopsis sp. LEGE 08334]